MCSCPGLPGATIVNSAINSGRRSFKHRKISGSIPAITGLISGWDPYFMKRWEKRSLACGTRGPGVYLLIGRAARN